MSAFDVGHLLGVLICWWLVLLAVVAVGWGRRGVRLFLRLLVVGPAWLVAWAMVAFDSGSAYRARRNAGWQGRYAARCRGLAVCYRDNAARARAAGRPQDALAQDEAAALMARLADDFTNDQRVDRELVRGVD